MNCFASDLFLHPAFHSIENIPEVERATKTFFSIVDHLCYVSTPFDMIDPFDSGNSAARTI